MASSDAIDGYRKRQREEGTDGIVTPDPPVIRGGGVAKSSNDNSVAHQSRHEESSSDTPLWKKLHGLSDSELERRIRIVITGSTTQPHSDVARSYRIDYMDEGEQWEKLSLITPPLSLQYHLITGVGSAWESKPITDNTYTMYLGANFTAQQIETHSGQIVSDATDFLDLTMRLRYQIALKMFQHEPKSNTVLACLYQETEDGNNNVHKVPVDKEQAFMAFRRGYNSWVKKTASTVNGKTSPADEPLGSVLRVRSRAFVMATFGAIPTPTAISNTPHNDPTVKELTHAAQEKMIWQMQTNGYRLMKPYFTDIRGSVARNPAFHTTVVVARDEDGVPVRTKQVPKALPHPVTGVLRPITDSPFFNPLKHNAIVCVRTGWNCYDLPKIMRYGLRVNFGPEIVIIEQGTDAVRQTTDVAKICSTASPTSFDVEAGGDAFAYSGVPESRGDDPIDAVLNEDDLTYQD